ARRKDGTSPTRQIRHAPSRRSFATPRVGFEPTTCGLEDALWVANLVDLQGFLFGAERLVRPSSAGSGTPLGTRLRSDDPRSRLDGPCARTIAAGSLGK